MIATFSKLRSQYGSKEITMDELKVIQSSGIVSFANNGISRAKKDCLLCIITFDALETLITEVTSRTFPDREALRQYVAASSLGLSERFEDGSLVFRDGGNKVEIIASVSEGEGVTVDLDDVEAERSFQVFLRVQH